MRGCIVLNRLAYSQNGTFYGLNVNGTARLNNRGRPYRFQGLHDKAQRLNEASDEISSPLDDITDEINLITDYMMNEISQRRNLVLHGADTTYASVQLSAQVLLLLLILVSAVGTIERRTSPR
jgi:hypothetical protein